MSILLSDCKRSVQNACRQILDSHAEAIGVAFKQLDCGCAWICGVSALGDPIGELCHVGDQAAKEYTAPVCLECRKDSSFRRVINQGIIWPGNTEELPDLDLRIFIGRRVFGLTYFEE